jgi:hypothetical protein
MSTYSRSVGRLAVEDGVRRALGTSGLLIPKHGSPNHIIQCQFSPVLLRPLV